MSSNTRDIYEHAIIFVALLKHVINHIITRYSRQEKTIRCDTFHTKRSRERTGDGGFGAHPSANGQRSTKLIVASEKRSSSSANEYDATDDLSRSLRFLLAGGRGGGEEESRREELDDSE